MTSSMKDVSAEWIMKLRSSLHLGLDILLHQFEGFNECVKQSSDITDAKTQMFFFFLLLVSSRFLAEMRS